MSDRVLRSLITPAPAWWRVIATAWPRLVRQRDLAEPARRQFRDGGLDQLVPPEVPEHRSDRPEGRTGMWAHVRTLWRRYRSRQQVALLDARALRDIGVSFAEAEAEANKPFWRK